MVWCEPPLWGFLAGKSPTDLASLGLPAPGPALVWKDVGALSSSHRGSGHNEDPVESSVLRDEEAAHSSSLTGNVLM